MIGLGRVNKRMKSKGQSIRQFKDSRTFLLILNVLILTIILTILFILFTFNWIHQHLMLDRALQNFRPSLQNQQSNLPKNCHHPKNHKANKYSQSINEYLPNFITVNPKPAQKVPNKDVGLRISMWETDSTQDMFDYESKRSVRVRDYVIDENHDIYVSGLDNQNQNENGQRDNMKKPSKMKCSVIKAGIFNENLFCGRVQTHKEFQYFIPGSEIDSYKVVGNCQQKSAEISVGSIIKIGRMKYIIKEIYDGIQNKTKSHKSKGKTKNIIQKQLSSIPSGTCKFCLCDENDNPDLLISPCKCKGSCAQVHVKCLQEWLTNKVSRKSTSLVEYLNYDNFSCQLCKDQLPTNFKINGKNFNMLKQEEKKQYPYLVMEGLPNKRSSTKNNITITLKFQENRTKLGIGRGHEADVRLQDVSISRLHCLIEFSKRKFMIYDNKSKFGTLLQLTAGQKLELGENKVQIGRMTVEVGQRKLIKAENRKIRQNLYP